jgi:hypothetical protein
MSNPAVVSGGAQGDYRAGTSNPSIAADTDTTPHRPHCVVTDSYCEALWWLRREPTMPSSVCCRHFWADVEARWSA